MAQIINDMDLGSMLGRQLGTGLSKGLSSLAQYKMQDIMKRQQQHEERKRFQTAIGALLPNLPQEQVENLSQFGPQLLQMLMHPQGLMSGFMGQNADEGAPYNVQVPFAPRGKQTFVTPKTVKKAMAKKALTQKHIDWFLKRANGDPKLATKLAKKAGYAA